MDGESSGSKKSKRGGRRRTAIGLRKHQQIDGVIVEEVFPLFDPSSSLSSSSSPTSTGEQKVGDGVYVTATTANNKRFYGVLIDQSSLKEASGLFFRDQSDSLRLNERMKLLNTKAEEEAKDKAAAAATATATAKRDHDAITTTTTTTTKVSNPAAPAVAVKREAMDIGSNHDDETGISNAAPPAPPASSTSLPDPTIPSSPPTKKARRLSSTVESNDQNNSNGDINNISNISNGNSNGNSNGTASETTDPLEAFLKEERPVQKFKYVEEPETRGSSNAGKLGRGNNEPSSRDDGSNKQSNNNTANNSYRILVATFSSIYEAACGDRAKARAIRNACEEGGNFLSGGRTNTNTGTSTGTRSSSNSSSSSQCYYSGDDSYYYQYESLPLSLRMDADAASKLAVIRTSMGFHSFLHGTALPPWYPLSNLYSQTKVLNLLNMKPGSNGKIEWDSSGIGSGQITGTKAVGRGGGGSNNSNSNNNNNNNKINHKIKINDVATMGGGTRLPMQPRVRKQYQIGVVGGGIAGLACCRELVTALKNDGIDARVTLVEARSRLGGRIATDRTWKTERNNVFPVELGASWIHGIDDNPLASLAETAGIEFVRASEEVKMVGTGMKEVDGKLDERMGKLFDDLLDHATEDCWTTSAGTGTAAAAAAAAATDEEGISAPHPNTGPDPQAAIRWYASCFSKHDADAGPPGTHDAGARARARTAIDIDSMAVDTPLHRRSNDRSVDCEIGKAIVKHKFRDFSKLSAEEHRMLLWNSKNVEYALGSNLDSLSMKYWDVDDRHALEGDHVLLKQGYSAVIDHMFRSLNAAGSESFECCLEFPVGKVEYGRKSATQKYGRDRFGRERYLTELSDSCSITSEDGSQTKFFDFLVSAVPLGVLKESVERESDADFRKKMTFFPSLPFSKIDAIRNVGFGLLNKVYIQFPIAFWRVPGFFKEDDDCLFGNVTGVHPHHYMFFDVGKRLGSPDDSPAILMSLVSGKEAVALECLSDAEVIQEVVETLRVMFAGSLSVPDPIGSRITRWGKDRFARGSYTYLPPGSTDEDFQLLQSPVNGNGDSLLLEGNAEVMRLFFAGEHTTALHPSVTHGAMLSGIRAAQEVVANIQSKSKGDKDVIDKVIPISIFRHRNPTTPLQCNLCHKLGARTREGPLLAFKRGTRQVLVHNNCAEYCPEVEVVDFKWKNVIRAVNRGRTFECCHCSQNGAAIGCSGANCYRMFHFSCAEDTGWRFDLDGKEFFCDRCRIVSSRSTARRCDRISTKYYATKTKTTPSSLACQLCRMPENATLGELLAFQIHGGPQHRQEYRMCCVHLNCVKYTNVVAVSEAEHSRMNHEYQNVFDVLQQSKPCSSCGTAGASIRCAVDDCDQVFHYRCAVANSNWDFQRKGTKKFHCEAHRVAAGKKRTSVVTGNAQPRASTAAVEFAKAAANQESAEKSSSTTTTTTNGGSGSGIGGLTFQHNLFASFGAMPKTPDRLKTSIPGNLDIDGAVHSPQHQDSPRRSTDMVAARSADVSDDESSEDYDEDSFVGEADDTGQGLEVMDLPLSRDIPGDVLGSTQLVRLERASRDDFWNISLQVLKVNSGFVVAVASADGTNGSTNSDAAGPNQAVSLRADDVIVSINESRVGLSGLETLRGILFRLKQEVDLMLEVFRKG